MLQLIRTLASRKARRGATALEYALVLAFVAVAVLAAMNTLGGTLMNSIAGVGTRVSGAVSTGVTTPTAPAPTTN